MNTKKVMSGVLKMVTICGVLSAVAPAMAEEIRISSINELAEYAGKSGNRIRMEPGLYRMTDYFTPERISEMNQRIEEAETSEKKRAAAEFIGFNGDDNVFDLRGVTLEFDTEELRAPLQQIQHTPEFVLRGNNNVLKGLNIVNTGNGTSDHGTVFSVRGNDNTMRDCTLVVRGSPYGFGLSLRGHSEKHSGLHISGDDNRFVGVNVHMRSLGHAFFLTDGPQNTYFEDCYAEGEVRTHEEMLEDLADLDSGYTKKYFTGEMRERYREDFENLKERLEPGAVTPLCEDGFRSYGVGKTTLIDCKAENVRGGFWFHNGGPVYMENCVVRGSARSNYRVGSGDDVLINCRADAKYDRLIEFGHRGRITADIELMPAPLQEQRQRPGALLHFEKGGTCVIRPSEGRALKMARPIVFSAVAPTRDMTLLNKTTMPVVITEGVTDSTIYTNGPVLLNRGNNVTIRKLRGYRDALEEEEKQLIRKIIKGMEGGHLVEGTRERIQWPNR